MGWKVSEGENDVHRRRKQKEYVWAKKEQAFD